MNFFLVQSRSSLQKIIISTCCLFWQEMSNFHLSLENDPKGGPLDNFSPNFIVDETLSFCYYLHVYHICSSTFSNIDVFMPQHIWTPFRCYVSHINIYLRLGLLFWLLPHLCPTLEFASLTNFFLVLVPTIIFNQKIFLDANYLNRKNVYQNF